MKKELAGFMLYKDQSEAMCGLDDVDAGKLIKALYRYDCDGSEPNFDNKVLMAFFKLFRASIDRNRKAYEDKCAKNSMNAKKRYATSNSHTEAFANSDKPKDAPPCDNIQSDANACLNKNNNKNNCKNKNNDINIDVDVIKEDLSVSVKNDSEERYSIERILAMYGKPDGNINTYKRMWDKLPTETKDKIIDFIPGYVKSHPNPRYRKFFNNFIYERVWESPINVYGEFNKVKDNADETYRINKVNQCKGAIDSVIERCDKENNA